MTLPQSTEEILSILSPVVGESIRQIQVLGVNSLKSVTPTLQDLTGSRITGIDATEREVRIDLDGPSAVLDLQRTGKVLWLGSAQPARFGQPGFPTVRILLESGSGVDFTEPAKTKRISLTLTSP